MDNAKLIAELDAILQSNSRQSAVQVGTQFLERCRAALSSPVASAQVPEDRNWREDYSHENGRYNCCCTSCGQMFVGHKRRRTCKVCAALAERNANG